MHVQENNNLTIIKAIGRTYNRGCPIKNITGHEVTLDKDKN